MERMVTVHIMKLNDEGIYESVKSARLPAYTVPGHRPPQPIPAYLIEISGEVVPEKSDSVALTVLE